MSIYSNTSLPTFSRPPEAIDELAAVLDSSERGQPINPRAAQLERDVYMQKAMQEKDAKKAYDFLQNYMRKKLLLPAGLLSPEEEGLFQLMLEENDSIPSFRVDPSKLDLREHRRPGPSYPGEDLERDNFLKLHPGSPLSYKLF